MFQKGNRLFGFSFELVVNIAEIALSYGLHILLCIVGAGELGVGGELTELVGTHRRSVALLVCNGLAILIDKRNAAVGMAVESHRLVVLVAVLLHSLLCGLLLPGYGLQRVESRCGWDNRRIGFALCVGYLYLYALVGHTDHTRGVGVALLVGHLDGLPCVEYGGCLLLGLLGL